MASVVRIGRRVKYDVYIGRACRGLPCSPYANPFIIGKHGSREEVIQKYKEWIYKQPKLIERARRELRGKVLACWCAPKKCHGDVLVEIASRGDILHNGVQDVPKQLPDEPVKENLPFVYMGETVPSSNSFEDWLSGDEKK